jgi:methionyl-tRNA formyltransferase
LPSGASIQILDSIPVEKDDDPPGTVRLQDRNVEIACGDGALRLLRVQPAGSDPMEAQALIQGRRLSGGEQLGINGVPEPVPPLVTPVES